MDNNDLEREILKHTSGVEKFIALAIVNVAKEISELNSFLDEKFGDSQR